MDLGDIARIRRTIYGKYGSCPHKKKVWLALLDRQFDSLQGRKLYRPQMSPPRNPER
jgi:hypothetical protein